MNAEARKEKNRGKKKKQKRKLKLYFDQTHHDMSCWQTMASFGNDLRGLKRALRWNGTVNGF